MSCNANCKKGFTIVELALALAFIAFLLLAIGTVTTQIAQVYQKGITIKNVNETGRELLDEFTSSIESEIYNGPWQDDPNDPSSNNNYRMTSMPDPNNNISRVPQYGAFCTGRVSYIWNSGYAIMTNRALQYVIPPSTSRVSFRLIKIIDANKSACTDPLSFPPTSLSYPQNALDAIQLNNINQVTELLSESSTNGLNSERLALFDFKIFKPKYHENTGHAFFSGTFILGTVTSNTSDVSITPVDRDICSGSSGENFTTDFVYCSINKFNFSARATGKV